MSVLGRLHAATGEDIFAVSETPLKFELLHHSEIYDSSGLDELDDAERVAILDYQPERQAEILYLEDWYHAVHYLLSGRADQSADGFPYNFVYGLRLELGETGWGKVQGYAAEDVNEIAAALDKMDLSLIKERYDAGVMNTKQIYPGNWPATIPDGLLETIRNTITFIHDLAAKELGFYRVLV
jgi:hypothetical protein